ncbi:MAG: hypothetical protein ABR530_10515 [Pyrinomonadaceae bacterium]
MTRQEIIEMIERAGFQAVERDTVYTPRGGGVSLSSSFALSEVWVVMFGRFAKSIAVIRKKIGRFNLLPDCESKRR